MTPTTATANFDTARESCRALGADLPIIRSEDDMREVVEWFVARHGTDQREFWIGLDLHSCDEASETRIVLHDLSRASYTSSYYVSSQLLLTI